MGGMLEAHPACEKCMGVVVTRETITGIPSGGSNNTHSHFMLEKLWFFATLGKQQTLLTLSLPLIILEPLT